ncbi:MAG TPA: TetR/AcrR family transcriptional regulator [Thermoanaerobaculia bacterium]|jgi:AcrR family transcriptional regulator|nr:TetR/AcrR family transcriptional regulator [Thermoanaerobaculia bacterium]
MQREEKSERSRRLVLDAALRLFSTRGFRATSVRDVAEAAGVSTGNLYHHFPDKEAIFRTLLDEYQEMTASEQFPLYRALQSGAFPDNLEDLGFAARDSVKQYRRYMLLVFVDVIEFDGTHIRAFYKSLAKRFAEIVQQHPEVNGRIRENVSPSAAMQLVARTFMSYFQLELLFGVPEPFGKDSKQIVSDIANMLRCGIAQQK